jgi:hypothetical protein
MKEHTENIKLSKKATFLDLYTSIDKQKIATAVMEMIKELNNKPTVVIGEISKINPR